MFPPKVTVRIFDFYQMRGDFIYYNWMLLDMVFNLLTDMKMIIHKKNSTYLLKMIIHKKNVLPQGANYVLRWLPCSARGSTEGGLGPGNQCDF